MCNMAAPFSYKLAIYNHILENFKSMSVFSKEDHTYIFMD